MNLQTKLILKNNSKNLINYNSKIVLLGSCFSDNIGKKLSYFKFQTAQNPFGIHFHAKAIEKLIINAVNDKTYTAEDVFFNNERWHCFDAHSNLSNPDKTTILNNLNTAVASTKKQLTTASHVIITLGTSWVYRFIETDTIVANCHKVPQKNFLKEIVSIDTISESLDAIVALIKSINPKATFLFTVSPVRHIKDGFVENMQSKAHLIAAIHKTVNPRKNIHYFPSYEIMMDELRDYRFYAEDMIHPNKIAIQYIWEKFTDTWFVENTKQTMKKVDIIQKGLSHKPFNEHSNEHQLFLEKLAKRKELLLQQFPFMSF